MSPKQFSSPAEVVRFIIHHTVLPPELPQADDRDPRNERALLDLSILALQEFGRNLGPEQARNVEYVRSTVVNLARVRNNYATVSEASLLSAMRILGGSTRGADGGALPIEVKAQNAGILISRSGDSIAFEAFELSPLNEHVMRQKGRLRRAFPASLAHIKAETYNEDNLQASIAQAIVRMSSETAEGFQPTARKSGHEHSENRDTTDPGLVTDMLMNVLAAVGEPANPMQILKNTREDVLFENALLPWRRSPLWLLIKVSIQLSFSRLGSPGENLYKNFMVFFLSKVLDEARRHLDYLGSDMVLAVSAKMSRRLLKLGWSFREPQPDLKWLQTVRTSMLAAHDLMAKDWATIREKDCDQLDPRPATLKALRPEVELDIVLPELDHYIVSMVGRTHATRTSDFRPADEYQHFPSHEFPTNLRTGDRLNRMTGFEAWVAEHLEAWLCSHIAAETTVGLICGVVETYHSIAKMVYDNDPRAMSLYYLTTVELWVAADKSACHIHPLLRKYDPEIPAAQLQGLLLPLKEHLQRLHKLETYIACRQKDADHPNISVFHHFGNPSSFAVQFYNQSATHQALLAKIEREATEQRSKKREELPRKQETCRKIREEHESMACETYIDRYRGYEEEQHDSKWCKKCQKIRQIDNITIGIHEWPLSSNPSTAKATVFELDVPIVFGNWRHLSAFVIMDVLGCEYSEPSNPRCQYLLSDDKGLRPYIRKQPSRIVPLSQDKAHATTHRREKRGSEILHLKDSDVCLANGLRYKYFDTNNYVFTARVKTTDMVSTNCTFKLPQRSAQLQDFLTRSPSAPDGKAPNEVIASQSNSPPTISLAEYRALVSLPCGANIQYQNILTQLAIPSLDWGKIETQIFILQIALQSNRPSPVGHFERAAHQILSDDTFAKSLLSHLRIATDRVEENWESWRALSSFIQLSLRIASLSHSSEAVDLCKSLLEKSRDVCMEWLKKLRSSAQVAVDDGQRSFFFSRACEIALVSISTFDTEQTILATILSSARAASLFIQCSIIVQEYKSTTTSEHPHLFQSQLDVWRRLMYRAFPILKAECCRGSCLDVAISAHWSAFRPGASWKPYRTSNGEHWLVTNTTPLASSSPITAHFNLLTAEFLVNGLPVGRLPTVFTTTAAYRQLFQKAYLDVVPTNVPGFKFETKQDYRGQVIRFGMDGYQLLVQSTSTSDTGERVELLPPALFKAELPTDFLQNFVHWYDFEKGEVEFCAIGNPWDLRNGTHWRLKKVGTKWQLRRGGLFLLSLSKMTARELSKPFATLEQRDRVHVLFRHTEHLVQISLPRLQLDFQFRIGDTRIFSRQYRGMAIAQSQSAGTLVGLSSKLLLERENNLNSVVLIPEGSVVYVKTPSHVAVSITPGTGKRVHAYTLDTILGSLRDNGNLQSRLYLCYLHALTAHCLPDPLCGKTGTEMALDILRSGATRSFTKLTQENIQLLAEIAKLTPERTYYPPNERVMQTVSYDSRLRSLAQHPLFYMYVGEIFEQARKNKMFFKGATDWIDPPKLQQVNSFLLERDIIRSSTFRLTHFGAEEFTVAYDTPYKGRDMTEPTARGERAYTTATLVLRPMAALNSSVSTTFHKTLWDNYLQVSEVQGPVKGPFDTKKISFGADWLLNPTTFLPGIWCQVHETFSQWPHLYNKFQVMMWLSTMAFSPHANMDVIQTLMAFHRLPALSAEGMPQRTKFDLTKGYIADKSVVKTCVKHGSCLYKSWDDISITKQRNESLGVFRDRRKRAFRSCQSQVIEEFTSALLRQWPCELPTTPQTNPTYLDSSKAMEKARPIFKAWHENSIFYRYLERMAKALKEQPVAAVPLPTPCIPMVTLPSIPHTRFVDTKLLFSSVLPPSLPPSPQPPAIRTDIQKEIPLEAGSEGRLQGLCDDLWSLQTTQSEKKYIHHLAESFAALNDREKQAPVVEIGDETTNALRNYLSECQHYFANLSEMFGAVLVGEAQDCDEAGSNPSVQSFVRLHRLPRVCASFYVKQLNQDNWNKIPEKWKPAIIKYALAISELQRAKRMMAKSGSAADLAEELANSGHTNWSPADFTETLLMEVESNFLVRPVQEEIAQEMREPQNGKNCVMQLNMGEGKSSVIVPMVAASLADAIQMVVIVVAKPQFKQMGQMLVSKLGGFLDRRLFTLPFSRALKVTKEDVSDMRNILDECLESRGILLVQPEHLLSFKLMGIECLLSGREKLGKTILRIQKFLEDKTRYIVDESDENFSVKFELVYTMGAQMPIDFSPARWHIIHLVLDLVVRYAEVVKKEIPNLVEILGSTEGGRRIRTLDEKANSRLMRLIAEHICKNGFMKFPVHRQPITVRQSILRYITKLELTPYEIAAVEESPFWTESTKDALMLIRGLIAGRVLAFILQSKRWRVNFGLDPSRAPPTRLAVPYRSKDSPTARSEFSHPDVVMILSTLCYYYGGLGDEELFEAFAHLALSDQRHIEFFNWVAGKTDIPDTFRHFSGINLEDRVQCVQEVFPVLRHSTAAINYYLSHIVFPREMKEFPQKLSVSGWDVGVRKSRPTTGFSGTCDARFLLPLEVDHLDLESQKHTNALVLSYLLQDKNSVQLLPEVRPGESIAETLLATVRNISPQPRVILDAGAQVLELNSLQLAKRWLEMSDPMAIQAVVYVNDDDELTVLDRKGLNEALQVSPFATQLNTALIYLDQQHTRGIDLVLPRDYRAAVTLGAKVTKDMLVQACMRMRKLGKGQSCVFIIPDEFKTKIFAQKARSGKTGDIGVADVLCWAISETWDCLRSDLPLWAAQGKRYEAHKDIFQNQDYSKANAEIFLEDESQTLEMRYRPFTFQDNAKLMVEGWDANNKNLRDIMQRCRDFDAMGFKSATLEEEQERELAPEIESERQIERPDHMEAEKHSIHPDLRRLITHGQLNLQSKAFVPAFRSLKGTNVAKLYDLDQFPTDLLVSSDFIRAVMRVSTTDLLDSYQRGVQWVMSFSGPKKTKLVDRLIILSPYEANELMLEIRQSSYVTLHLYAPRSNLAYDSLDSLELYTVGVPFEHRARRSVTVQLNLFAGQLYFGSYDEYIESCEFLGLAWSVAKDDEVVQADGFITPPAGTWRLKDSPVEFLRNYITNVRRDCESIDKTHIGKVLDGALLEERGFV